MTPDKLINFCRITSTLYSEHKLRKRSGGLRKIHVPSSYLKFIQYRILTLVLDKIVTADYLYAFEKGKSVVDKAAAHVGKKYVISFDIKDFFPSVTTHMVVSALEAHGLEKPTATLISELCCYKYFLPQGAVTSPKLSNLVVQKTFGPEIEEYCKDRGISFTVYADDITLSLDEGNIEEVISFVQTTVSKHGFIVHSKGKLKVMPSSLRQEVCGIVVNDTPSISREQRKTLRSQVHYLATGRTPFDGGKTIGKSQIEGRIGWVSQVNSLQSKKLKEVLSKAATQ